MATRKVPLKKNPAPAGTASEEVTRTWILKPSGERVRTATVHTPDGQYVAVVQDSKIAFVGGTKAEAERGALDLYRNKRSNPTATMTEDEADAAVCEQRKHEPFYTSQEFLKRHGRT